MIKRLQPTYEFFKTTAIGGILFLLPLFVVLGLLGYVYQFVAAVHEEIRHWIPLDSATAFFLLFIAVVGALLAVCFAAGLAARRAIGVHLRKTLEKHLTKFFPKYGIYKDLLAGTFGGESDAPSLRPVLVKRDGALHLALEADRLADGLVVVYFPGAPDPWNGTVALVAPEQLQPADISFAELVGVCERLGRDAAEHLKPPPRRSNDD